MIKNRQTTPRPPRLGKIKIGIKEYSDKAKADIPKSIDWFRATGNFSNEFHKVYGAKPNKIRVIFPYNDVEENLNEFYRHYKSGGLYCIGDGEKATRIHPDNISEEIDCPCKHWSEEKGGCNATINCNVVILGLHVVGVWAIQSGGVNTTNNLRGALELTKNLAGKITGIPFILSVEKVKSTLSGNPNVYPVITATPDAETEQLLSIGKELSASETFLMLSGQKTVPHPELEVSETETKNLAVEDEKQISGGSVHKMSNNAETDTNTGNNQESAEDEQTTRTVENESDKNADEFGEMADDGLKKYIMHLLTTGDTATVNKWNAIWKDVLNAKPVVFAEREQLLEFARTLKRELT